MESGRASRRKGVGRAVTAALVIVVVVVAAVAVYAELQTTSTISTQCGAPTNPSSSSSQIQIGYITELSGPGVVQGYGARIGAELAVNATNAAGGIDGRSLQLVVEDDQTVPSTAVQEACSLDERGVLAITGPTDQGVALEVEKFSEANSIPFVVSAVSSAELNPPGLSWTATVQPDPVQWGAAMAKYVSETVPGAKLALLTQNAEEQREMAAGVRWFADTFKNESIVFDQVYANAQFPWATAAEAAKFSGANAVVVSWVSTAGFSESNVVIALLSAGFQPNQIFIVSATNEVGDLGVGASGASEGTLFDGAMARGYPNATAFYNDLQPFVNGALNSTNYCGICPTEIGPLYYYSYLGMEMMISSIREVLSSGQALTRASFMAAMKHASVEDAFGNALSVGPGGAAVGSIYIATLGPLNSTQSTYTFLLTKTIRFSPGTVPSYQLAKTA